MSNSVKTRDIFHREEDRISEDDISLRFSLVKKGEANNGDVVEVNDTFYRQALLEDIARSAGRLEAYQRTDNLQVDTLLRDIGQLRARLTAMEYSLLHSKLISEELLERIDAENEGEGAIELSKVKLDNKDANFQKLLYGFGRLNR